MMHATIAGHLGADVETRYTDKGKKVSTIRVAVNTRRAGKDETIWWNVSLWGDAFDGVLPYLKKGAGVIVQGDFILEKYNDRDGKQQVSVGMSAKSVTLNPFGRADRAGQETSYGAQQQTGASQPHAAPAASSSRREELASPAGSAFGSSAKEQDPSPMFGEYAAREDVPF